MTPHWTDNATDQELLDELRSIDESDASVSSWESQFIESVVYKGRGTLSAKQREAAKKIVQKYRS